MSKMAQLLLDLRYSARKLFKTPEFTIITILTFAIGIGANCAVFTLTYVAILKSLPVPNPAQLVRYAFRNGPMDFGISGPAYDALRKRETVNVDLLAWSAVELAVEDNGTLTRVNGGLLSGNGFRVLELNPPLGKPLDDPDDVKGGGADGYQALISYNYWKRRFNQDQRILGQTLTINGRRVTVSGVLPEDFEGLTAGQRTDIILPLAFEEAINSPRSTRQDPGTFWLTVIGRLKPGQSLRSAEANLRTIEAAVRQEADPTHQYLTGFFASFHFGVESGRGGMSLFKIRYGPVLILLELLVGLLLILCCANIGLLMIARVGGRFREFALCGALGAPRARLLQSVLGEVLLLAICGLAGGIALGWISARALVAMLAGVGEPLPLNTRPNMAVFAFAALITLLAAVGAGLVPALRACRVDLMRGLKETQQLSTSNRFGQWMIPVQVGLSITLLTSASLLGFTLFRLLVQKSGFQEQGIVLANVDVKANKLTQKEVVRSAQLMVESIQSEPGIEAATALSSAPLSDVWAAGHYFSKGEQGIIHSDMQTWPEFVLPDYFRVTGTRIIQGREFTAADQEGDPVCVLSASAAAYFFPNQDPIGQFVYAGGANSSLDGKTAVSQEDTCRVIGKAENTRFRSLREPPPRMLYKLIRPDSLRNGFLIAVRSRSNSLASKAIANAVRRVTPTAVSPSIFTFKELVNTHLRGERIVIALSLSFAGIALLLTALGLYGLLTRSLVLRVKEIGVRLALGATPRTTGAWMVWQGLKLVLLGIILAIPLTIVVTGPIRTLLYGIHATNPLIFLCAVVFLLIVALGACYVPMRRAMALDPMTALRNE